MEAHAPLGVMMGMLGDIQYSLRSSERSAALRRVLDGNGQFQETLDRLARLASRVLYAPIVLVSVLEDGKPVLRSSIGLPGPWRASRDHPLMGLLRDLTGAGLEDERKVQALRELGVEAVAASPLGCLGQTVGTLWVMDTRARRWLKDDLHTLRELAAFSMGELELRLAHEWELAARTRQARREQATARKRMALLVDASAMLADVAQSEASLQRLAERLVPELGILCVVDLLRDGPFTAGARVAHVDPEATRRLRDLVGSGPQREVWLAGAGAEPARLSPEGASFSVASGLEALLPRLGVQSLLRVPVLTSQGLEGLLTLGRGTRKACPYLEPELEVARTLAGCIAMALENARLFRKVSDGIRQRDEFLSIAAHELRTPLTPLKLQLDTLRRSVVAAGLTEPRVLWHLERSTVQVQRLVLLVERLLDVSRVSTGRLGLLLEKLDLSSLAIAVVDSFREEAEAAGSRLEVHTSAPVFGMWDQLRLEQVLSSLLSNAIKYGAGRPIDVSVEGGEELARLSVRDHGIGLAREDSGRIFQRFERAVSPKRYGGLGLGLYVAKQIIEAHGGNIVVQSQPGEGSTFTVILPTRSPPRQMDRGQEAPAALSDG